MNEKIFTIPEAPGYRFLMSIEDDDTNEAPWDRCDGHGTVRRAFSVYDTPRKQPGERLMYSERGDHWFYDWQGACKLARKDKWNAEPYDAPNRIERAVQADFDFLRGWLAGHWNYIGVTVRLLDENDEPRTGKYDFALWGIESCAGGYLDEIACALALECANVEGITLKQRRAAWRAALIEARERKHWAQRDVTTV